MYDVNPDDKEIERINKQKLEEIMKRKMKQQQQHAQSQHTSQGRPIVLTDASFFSEVSKYPLMVVDFWAPWCGPCRMVGPVIEQLAKEYAGKVTFGKLNVDENPVVSNAFGVQSIPTILVFHQGKAVDGVLGAVPKSHIESKFKPYLSGTKGEKNSNTFYG